MKGGGDYNNYRQRGWIMCATSRTMFVRFALTAQSLPHLQENNKHVIPQ